MFPGLLEEEKKDLNIDLTKKLFDSIPSIKKYMFPLEKLKRKQELKNELQKPLTVTAEEILKDLLKFVKDFPVDVIPHMNEEEI